MKYTKTTKRLKLKERTNDDEATSGERGRRIIRTQTTLIHECAHSNTRKQMTMIENRHSRTYAH